MSGKARKSRKTERRRGRTGRGRGGRGEEKRVEIGKRNESHSEGERGKNASTVSPNFLVEFLGHI